MVFLDFFKGHLMRVSMNLVLWHVTSPDAEVLVIPLVLQKRSYKSGTILTDWQRIKRIEMVTKVKPKLSSCCCFRFLVPLRLQTLCKNRLQNSLVFPKDPAGEKAILVTKDWCYEIFGLLDDNSPSFFANCNISWQCKQPSKSHNELISVGDIS